jgi:AmmeMemoRadiSam system protein B/AmmeMemoRadiSam system protein A
MCCLLTACGEAASPTEAPPILAGATAAAEAPVSTEAPATAGPPTPTVTGEIRPAAYAGTWYSGDPQELASSIDAMLNAVAPIDGEPMGLIVPHAGHVYSGPVAAYGYRQIEGIDYDTVVIIGPNHRDPAFTGISIWPEGGFETPLGVVAVNQEIASALMAADDRIVFDRGVQLAEHSIEIQLPFLQRACPRCTIVPIVIGQPTSENVEALTNALVQVLAGRHALIIASTDLSHYPAYNDAVRVDSSTLAAVETGDPNLLEGRLAELMDSGVPGLETCMCGEDAVLTLMRAMAELGGDTVTILDYGNSGDVSGGDPSQVVGYGAVMFWHYEPPELDAEAQELLLSVARYAIAEELGVADEMEAPDMDDPILARRSAVFVTLMEGGELRGCIGQLVAQMPLGEAIQQAALAAAFDDPRFPPLGAEELEAIRIEISVLSPFRRVTDVEADIQVGTHGLLLVNAAGRGLLLPQVAADYGWTREEFLQAVSEKAGLPSDAWQNSTLYTFTAEVFGEEE